MTNKITNVPIKNLKCMRGVQLVDCPSHCMSFEVKKSTEVEKNSGKLAVYSRRIPEILVTGVIFPPEDPRGIANTNII